MPSRFRCGTDPCRPTRVRGYGAVMGDELSPGKLLWRRINGRRRWPVVDGVVIDKRHLRTREARFESSRATISYDEYLVEVTGPDGEPARVRIQEDHIEIPRVIKHTEAKGKKVRVHVHPDGEKAVFAKDFTESKQDQKQREKERKARDEERFRRQQGEA